jgi:hypothetical protein
MKLTEKIFKTIKEAEEFIDLEDKTMLLKSLHRSDIGDYQIPYKIWEYKNFDIIVARVTPKTFVTYKRQIHLCSYLVIKDFFINKDSQTKWLNGKLYNKLIEKNLLCHGSITFQDRNVISLYDNSSLHLVIGLDAMHYGDFYEIFYDTKEDILEYLKDSVDGINKNNLIHSYKTIQYMYDEAKNLQNQFHKFANSNPDLKECPYVYKK